MIALVVLLPLVAAIAAIAIIPRYSVEKYVAIAGSLIASALIPTLTYGLVKIPWFSIGQYTFDISISLTPLNLLLLSLVLGIGSLVMIYSAGYMDNPTEQKRYYIEMLSFQAAMALFAISGNFITLLIAWEFLSLTSYLLIGFWYNKDSATRAARKALTMVFLGDLALLGAIVIFWHAYGTLEFYAIATAAAQNSTSLYVGTLLLLVAVFTKSAQFPFHEWLIDAMEGPTPVSAFLHSSTMVKAGVFAVIILYPIFAVQAISSIVLVIGLITAVIATLGASREMHIKKVIAYSTVQELSIMLIALASGAVLAAIYFFLVQSFYKALLFFSSGVVMKATEKENLNEASGLGTRKVIYISTLVGVLSLAGFVPFSGFFANEGISSSISSNLALYAIMTAISMLTSFYIMRWFSYSARKARTQEIENGYFAQPRSMVYPMVLLAALTVVVSAFFFPIGNFMNSGSYLSYLSMGNAVSFSIIDAAIFTVVIAIGALIGYRMYSNRTKPDTMLIDRIVYTRYMMNWLYNLVSLVTYELSSGINAFDSYLNEGFDSIGRITLRSGYGIRRVSVGNINSYAIIFIVGMLVISLSFYYLVVV